MGSTVSDCQKGEEETFAEGGKDELEEATIHVKKQLTFHNMQTIYFVPSREDLMPWSHDIWYSTKELEDIYRQIVVQLHKKYIH